MIYNDKNDSLFKWIDLWPIALVVIGLLVFASCVSKNNEVYDKRRVDCMKKGGELHYWKYEGYVCLKKELIIK